MIVRKVLGLSLPCALLVCAVTAQSAFATAATNTTAVTCTENGGAKDFSDAHCDNKTAGKFGHTAIANGVKTEVSITNAKTKNNTTESTPAIFKGTAIATYEVVCSAASGTGTLENSEPTSKQHKVTGTATVNLTSCTVVKPAGLGCKADEPIEIKSNVEGVEGLGSNMNEMGLEFKPTSGSTFAKITFNGPGFCDKLSPGSITGTAIGTGTPAPTEKHSGTTNVFTNAMTKETLKSGGNPAEFSSSTTVTTKTGGSPVALTTAT